MDTRPGVRPKGPLIVVSGPSAVGKTTVVERLLGRRSLPIRRAVSATTRPARDGEVDGIHYHFWTPEEFRTAIDAGRMLEWAVVFGRDFYGTPRAEVDPYRADGVGVILVIDVQGAGSVRSQYPGDHVSVFISAPTFDELEKRLLGRGGMPADLLRRRLETAQAELARAGEFDYQIVNRDLETTVAELEQLVSSQLHN